MAERSDKVIPPQTAYEDDFHAWLENQAQALRAGDLHRLDLVNLADEVEGLGASERRELRSRLAVLIQHLLKWQLQPENHCGSWRGTINEQRYRIELVLQDSPSLRRRLPEFLPKAYARGSCKAVEDMTLLCSPFPETCPYSVDDILSEDFFPELGRKF
jgi:hypothetical protein